jgi:hypothetical protein
MAKIDLKKKVTSRLSLEPIKTIGGENYMFGGLVPAILVNITMTQQAYKAGEFEGMTLDCLSFEFENFKLTADEPDRFLTHTEKAVGTVKNEDGTPVPREVKDIEKNIEDMWFRIKHILDQCYTSPNYRDISEIKQADIEKYFDLPAEGTPAERAEKFKAFFEYIVKFANGDGDKLKPIYKLGDGSDVAMWLKILPNYPEGKYYNLPTFVGQGFAEAAKIVGNKLTAPKVIKVKPSETLELSSARRNRIQGGGEDSSLPSGEGVDAETMKVLQGMQ